MFKLKKKKLDDNHLILFNNKEYKFNTYKVENNFFDDFKDIFKLLIQDFFKSWWIGFLSKENIVLPFKANIKRTNLLEYSNKNKNERDWNYKFQPLKNGYKPKQKDILFFNMLKEFDILIRK